MKNGKVNFGEGVIAQDYKLKLVLLEHQTMKPLVYTFSNQFAICFVGLVLRTSQNHDLIALLVFVVSSIVMLQGSMIFLEYIITYTHLKGYTLILSILNRIVFVLLSITS